MHGKQKLTTEPAGHVTLVHSVRIIKSKQKTLKFRNTDINIGVIYDKSRKESEILRGH